MSARFKVFFIHLLCSLAIALGALGLVFGLWYPAPLHLALGVTSIFLLLLAVDVTLGPLLTLVVYKTGKKSLKFDLTVIVALQLAALGYGLWTVAQGRPAWLAFNVDRFDVVPVVDIDTRRLAEALPQYQAPAWTGPRWVAAVRPVDGERRNEILFEVVLGGSDIAQRPELYRPLADLAGQMKSRAQNLDQLVAFNEGDTVAAVLAAWPQATGWLPLMARVQPMVVLLADDNTMVLAIVPLRPWL
ncbi:MAG: type IV pilin accessory protein [Stenotrophomonas sp.]|uniref:Type IV pilin accessory protein n=1 Tax=Ectopseudomonas oleovorans TaxID=301 RepID=A0AA42QA17_ECTOL|nr:TfpX/TfpZ family type IV pilin accessory protein [Pseudomonas oleovorans]PZU23643.1 MAG: type IV pilin accessory protein [Stenotrophomonas sp.]MDH1339935.1 type IV pilin accessory protein [Pseudomonas oleovorans]MDH1492724.1 type IV pilin accessory protein [Pseudomonas oleovorans]MDH2198444.1 type IV pilin accessory protein [Pseudomonas oleovorans]WGG21805.1 type IV pilin accessory protein [Pseudomonas oleovorans]